MKYVKLPEEQYRKLLFQTRGQYIAILNVFRCYGLDPYVDSAIDECMKVTENFGQIVRGDDKPIHILNEPKERATE
jgi:hypothetical protein